MPMKFEAPAAALRSVPAKKSLGLLTFSLSPKRKENMKTKTISLAITGLLLALFASRSLGSQNPVIRAQRPVPGEYMVRIERTIGNAQFTGFNLVRAHGGIPLDYIPDIQTVFAKLSDAEAVALNANPLIRSVEENAILETAPTQSGLLNPPSGQMPNNLWGLDRVDQYAWYDGRTDGNYTWSNDGTGIRIYMIDTGIYSS